MRRLVWCCLMLGLTRPAMALDPYMWGVGPRVGTMVIPGRFPMRLPVEIDAASGIERVRNDVAIGVEGVFYVNAFGRMVVDGDVAFGRRYIDTHLLVKYGYVAHAGSMDFIFGGGLGFGTMLFKGEDPSKLAVPYYPFRAEMSALVRDNARGYQASVYGQYNVPANQFYVAPTGVREDVSPGIYPMLGIEISVLFGDFTPPRPRLRDIPGTTGAPASPEPPDVSDDGS